MDDPRRRAHFPARLMRALQIVEPGVARVNDVDVPEPGPGEVLLRVGGAGICHSDLHVLHAPGLQGLPLTLGHEVAGFVERLGPGVDRVAEGEPVVVYLVWGCGSCRACADGFDNYCESVHRMGYGVVPGLPAAGGPVPPGGMADFQVVPARALTPIGDLDPVAAAPLADAGLTAYHAVEEVRPRLTPSSTALVVGVGGLGHAAIQIIRSASDCRIVAVDVSQEKLDLASRLGADAVIKADDGARDRILEASAGKGADVVMDFVGVDATVELARRVVARRGHIALVGAGGAALQVRTGALPLGVSTSLPFAGSRRDLIEVLALARRGHLEIEIERYPLEDALNAFARLEAGEVMGRAVVTP